MKLVARVVCDDFPICKRHGREDWAARGKTSTGRAAGRLIFSPKSSLLAKVLRSNFVGVFGRDLMPLQAYAREKKSGKTLSCETCYVLVSYRPLALTSRGFVKRCHTGYEKAWQAFTT